MNTSAFRSPVLPFALAIALLTALFLLMSPAPASAHDEDLESSPAAGATVETMPDEVTVTFNNNPVDSDGATEFAVTDATGKNFADGAASINGNVATQKLITEADAGVYTVSWKIVSSDGHNLAKQFDFTVATSTLPAAPEPTAPAEPTASAEPTAAASDEAAQPTDEPTVAPITTAQDDSVAWGLVIAVISAVAIAVIIILLVTRARRTREHASSTNTSAR